MNQLKVLPSNTASFYELRKNDLLYVDKTEFLFPLLRKGKPKFFMRRPRRFGKSLTVSTLEAMLQGKKELFNGLWIYDKWDWTPYSVIRFDFSQISRFKNDEELTSNINDLIVHSAKMNGVTLEKITLWRTNLTNLLSDLKLKGPVAILIDEYDNPFHKALDWNKELQDVTRDVFRDFYGFLKSLEDFYDFMFVTGITKIAQTSVFSGLNMITDISLEPQYAALCGITQSELESNFSAHIDHMAIHENVTREKILANLKEMYNGYRFSHMNMTRVYNPFSLMNAFETKETENFWFQSGTPTLLINLIRNNKYSLSFLDSPKVTLREVKNSYEFESMSLANLLYQTGYLTIGEVYKNANPSVKEASSKETSFSLIYPNQEVKRSFLEVLLNAIRQQEITPHENDLGGMIVTALKNQQWSDFVKGWNELLTHIPFQHHIPQESYYHSLFMIFAALNGLDAQAERMTSVGKMDVAIEFEDKIYVIEFKLNTNASVALKQIHTKKYYEIFMRKGKPITLIGIAFDSKKKYISEILSEEINTSQKLSKVQKVYSVTLKSRKKGLSNSIKKADSRNSLKPSKKKTLKIKKK